MSDFLRRVGFTSLAEFPEAPMGQRVSDEHSATNSRGPLARPLIWAVGAVLAGGLIALAVLASGGPEPSATPDLPDPMAIRTAHDGGGAHPAPDDTRPRRSVEVAVTTCHGEPVAGAVVLTEAGGERLSATSDPDGYARLRVLDGEVKVVARLSTLEVAAAPTRETTVAVDLCPGATVHGQVVDAWGSPQPGVRLALTDDLGEVLEEVESDVDGGYGLTDLGLEGAGLLVDGEVRPLVALAPREDRELDVLVGPTRKVRGFVLDLRGDPVPGVVVTLKPMAFEGRGWSAITNSGGAFSLIGPTTAGRVDADGGDLGQDRAWVGPGRDEKVVDFVLEPVGTLTVVKPDSWDPQAKVSVRCWDSRALGPDQGWLSGPSAVDEPHELTPEEMQAQYGEGPYPDTVYDSVPTEEAATASFDEARMQRVLRRVVAELVPELVVDGDDGLDPAAYLAALQQRVEAMPADAKEALEKRMSSPGMSKRLQKIALEELGAEGLGLETDSETFEDPPQPESDVAHDVDPEGGIFDPETGRDIDDLGEPELAPSGPVEVEGFGPNMSDRGEVGDVSALGETELDENGMPTGGADFYAPTMTDEGEPLDAEPTYEPSEVDRFATWAEGVLGEALTVPANRWYEVYVERQDGSETPCGRVRVNAGDEVVVQCGGRVETSVVEGRFVDRDGRPVGNLEVWYTASNMDDARRYHEGRMITEDDGRFRFELEGDRTVTVTVGVAATSDEWSGDYGRRNVVLGVGADVDLGDLTWIAEGERPESWPTAAYGGIGGLIELDDEGVVILDMEDDSPLALAGVEHQDTIVLIDGVPASELPQDEVFLRLRGAPGTSVDLRVRSAEGDLYEVTVDRQMMAAPDETWGAGATASAPEADPGLE